MRKKSKEDDIEKDIPSEAPWFPETYNYLSPSPGQKMEKSEVPLIGQMRLRPRPPVPSKPVKVALLGQELSKRSRNTVGQHDDDHTATKQRQTFTASKKGPTLDVKKRSSVMSFEYLDKDKIPSSEFPHTFHEDYKQDVLRKQRYTKQLSVPDHIFAGKSRATIPSKSRSTDRATILTRSNSASACLLPITDIVTLPRCLISTGKGNELNIEEDVIMALALRDKPAVVVGIAGKYRSGKSYLMNRLAGKPGFSLGSTIEAKTKGIWIWVMDHPKNKDWDLILLDTEGLGDIKKIDEKHDAWIFCLTVLLSSHLVFNITGVFDHGNIDILNLVVELSSKLKTKSDREPNDDSDFDAHCPYLVMTIRDFTLDLEAGGQELTADEYLEHCLKGVIGRKGDKMSNAILHIRKYFKRRRCFVFEMPTKRKKMSQLETLDEKDIDADFVAESKRFMEFILQTCQPKLIGNKKKASGRVLAGMLRSYIACIKKGDVPCIEGTLHFIADDENRRAVDGAVQLFEQHVEKICLPMEANELEKIAGDAKKAALNYFEENVIENQEDEEQFMRILERLSNELAEKNMQESEEKCQALLDELARKMHSKIESNDYFKVGGHGEYIEDVRNLEERYRNEKDLGVMKIPTLEKFLKSLEVIANMVKKFDTQQEAKVKTEIETSDMKNDFEKKKSQYEIEIRLLKEKMAEQQKVKNAMMLREIWADIKDENMQDEDKKQEEMDRLREEEINNLNEEGRTTLAHSRVREQHTLATEYLNKKEKKKAFWQRLFSFFWKKPKPCDFTYNL